MRSDSKFTKEQLAKVHERYLNGESITEIAKENNVVADTIYRQFRRNGYNTIERAIMNRIYSLDETYFDVIDSEEKAYFLGLLYADGSHNLKKYCISLELQEEDKPILDKLTIILQPDKPLFFNRKRKENHKNSYKFYVSSKYMSNRLSELGVGQNKAFTIRLPELRDDLIHHFIRGFFDGDGCISIYLIKNKYQSCSFSITSNREFLEKIQEILIEQLQLNKTKLARDNRGNNISSLVYGGKQNCLKIRDWLYKDATVYLQRKHDKFYSI